VLSLLSNRLDKLPQTKEVLLDIVETTEQFQLRRIESSIKVLKLKFPVVKAWEVAKEAGLKSVEYRKFKNKINEKLNEML
jgi:hypothetical protein